MKKLLFAIALLGMAASCTLNEFDKVQKSGKNTISVVAGEQTRMAIATDDNVTFKHIWEKDDAITVFDGPTAVKYVIVGEGGDVKADFTGDALKEEAPYPVFYPYSEDNIDIYEQVNLQNIFRYDFPTEATYQDGEHVIGGHVMYGFCYGGSVDLKNACSFVRISLSAQELSYLDAIQIHAIGGEAIAGPAMIGIDEYGVPTFEFDEKARVRDVDYSTFTVKFDSSRWITAGGTSFYVALPPVELSKGLEFFFEGEFSGDKEIYLKSSSATLERNTVLLMPNHDIKISYGLLANGKEFNYYIKKMYNDTVTKAWAYNGLVPDVKKIVFQTDVDLTDVDGVDVSALGDGSVIAVKDGSTVTVSTSFPDLRLNADASFMFSKMDGLETVENFDILDTKMATTIRNMFWNAKVLKNIDFSKMDVRNVTSIWSTFCNMYEFDDTHLAQIKKWDTRKITNVNYAFCGTKITSVDFYVDDWDLPAVTGVESVFQSCSNLTEINWAGKNIPGTSLYSAFYTCKNLKKVDMHGAKASKVKNLSYLFYGCTALESVNMANVEYGEISTVSYLFSGCTKLNDFDFTGMDTKTVTSMYRLFYNCSALPSAPVNKFLTSPGFNTANVVSMGYMFAGCSALDILFLTNFDTSSASGDNAQNYFLSGTANLKEITLGEKFELKTSHSYFMSNGSSGRPGATTISNGGTLTWITTPELAQALIRFSSAAVTFTKNNQYIWKSIKTGKQFVIDPISSSAVVKEAD